MIPKIIHQIWLGPNKRPDIWMNSWKINYIKKHPDWTYKLWTEKEINMLQVGIAGHRGMCGKIRPQTD